MSKHRSFIGCGSVLLTAGALAVGGDAAAQEVSPAGGAAATTAQESSGSFVMARNPTGRKLDLIVPVRVNGRPVSDLLIFIDPSSEITFAAVEARAALGSVVNEEALALIDSLAEEGGRVSLRKLRAAGLDLRYLQASVTLDFIPSGQFARASRLERGASLRPIPSDVAQPADVAAYANFRSVYRLDNIAYGDDRTTEGDWRVGVDGAARIFGLFTLEAEGFVEDDRVDGVRAEREGTRLVYDHLGTATRWRAGDLSFPVTGFQTNDDLLGIEVARRYDVMGRGLTLRPRGRGRFELSRRSTVSILVNGVRQRTLELDAGLYDIEDLSLSQGANDVQIVVEDADGRVETLEYSLFFDSNLLTPGLQEFAAALGVRAEDGDEEIDYKTDEPIGSVFYRAGVTDQLTLGVNAQSSNDIAQLGVEALAALRFGSLKFDAAGSAGLDDDDADGFAVGLDYTLTSINVFTPTDEGVVTLSGQFASPEFSDLDGVAEPEFGLQFDGAYRQRVGDFSSAGLFGSYDVGRSGVSDQYRFGLSASSRIFEGFSVSAQAGHERDVDLDGEGGLFAAVGFSYAFGVRSRVFGDYDSEDNLARLGASQSRTLGDAGDLSYGAQVERDDETSEAGAFVNFDGDRFFAEAEYRAFSGGQFSDPTGDELNLRVDTALAFADGAVGVSKPISGAFAIVTGETTPFGGVSIDEDTTQGVIANDAFGPPVISGLSEYQLRDVVASIDPDTIGGAIVSDAFTTYPAYRAGYNLRLEDVSTITIIGQLIDDRGDPVVASAGWATKDGDDDTVVRVFTNKTGRVVGEGFSPGQWTLKVADMTYRLALDEGATAFTKVGTLRPEL